MCLHTRWYHFAFAANLEANDKGKFSRTVVAVDNERRGNLWTHERELRNKAAYRSISAHKITSVTDNGYLPRSNTTGGTVFSTGVQIRPNSHRYNNIK